MNVWKITISEEDLGLFETYYGRSKKAKEAGEKALKLAQKQVMEDKNFDGELYVSEISFVAYLEF